MLGILGVMLISPNPLKRRGHSVPFQFFQKIIIRSLGSLLRFWLVTLSCLPEYDE